jgi:ABC-type transport system involved in multi-copper enzyme maturation permease subunit
MSRDVVTAGPPEPGTAEPDRPTGGGTWSLSVVGVRTVMRLELRQRVRATRWVVVLAVWTGLLALLTGLIWLALGPATGDGGMPDDDAGSLMFGIIVLLVLSLGSLVAPALSATSVNGDRNSGILATLQTTLLTPAEIAVGKLLAAWVTSLALFVTATPFLLIAYLIGGTPFSRLVVVLVLLALMLGVVCAVALGWSAICARTSSSAVLTYITVAFLGLGLPLLFGLSLPFVTTTDTVTVRVPAYEDGVSGGCVEEEQVLDRAHTELTWWMLAASPYVVVSDAAPQPDSDTFADDPLSAIREGVREARLGPEDYRDWCRDGRSDAYVEERRSDREDLSAAWPWGLAIDLSIAGGFVALTVRRLRTPTRSLPRGTRVA